MTTTKKELLDLIQAYAVEEDVGKVHDCYLAVERAVDALWADAESHRKVHVPAEVGSAFVEVTDRLVGEMRGLFIECVAMGADNLPGLRDHAELFCRWNSARIELGKYVNKKEVGN